MNAGVQLQREPARETLSDHGIVSMLGAGLDTPAQRRLLLPSALLLVVAWLGFIAWIGPYVGSPVAGALLAAVPRQLVLWGAGLVLGGVALTSRLRGQSALAGLATLLLAYHVGTGLFAMSYGLLSPLFDSLREMWGVRFAARRMVYGLAVCLPMAAVWYAVYRRPGGSHLGRGDWAVRTRPARKDSPVTWRRMLMGLALTGGLPVFLMMQAVVQFEPIRSGALLGLLVPVLLVSLVNATVEEYIFRGFALPAIVGAAGPARGLWLTGIWFGLHHWGLSVQVLTSLPGALLLGFGSIFFGKSVLETRGLAWAIAAHMVFDIAIFSAFYGRL